MNIEFIVLIFSLVILQSPLLISSEPSGFLPGVVLLPFWIVILNNFFKIKCNFRFRKCDSKMFITFAIFVAFLVLALLRADADIMPLSRIFYFIFYLLTIVLFGFAVFLLPKNQNKEYKLRMGIIYAIAIYICINVLLDLLGIKAPVDRVIAINGAGSSTQLALMLSLLNIKAYRTLFPMTEGVNNFGFIAGSSLILGIAMLIFTNSKLLDKLTAIIIILASLYAILLSDMRGALVAALATAVIIIILKLKVWLKLMTYLALIIPNLPLILMQFSFIISNNDFLNYFSRSKNNIGTFGGRSILWEFAIEKLSNFSLIHIVGFGIYGQVSSGVSQGYSKLFLNRHAIAPEAISLHNASLQYILDIGYLGFTVFMLLLFFVITKLLKELEFDTKGISKITIVLIMYCIFAGLFEIVPTIYSKEIFAIFLLVIISSLPKVSYLKGNFIRCRASADNSTNGCLHYKND